MQRAVALSGQPLHCFRCCGCKPLPMHTATQKWSTQIVPIHSILTPLLNFLLLRRSWIHLRTQAQLPAPTPPRLHSSSPHHARLSNHFEVVHSRVFDFDLVLVVEVNQRSSPKSLSSRASESARVELVSAESQSVEPGALTRRIALATLPKTR